MKVTLVTPYLGEYGGQERVTYELFLYLKDKYQVQVLTQKVDPTVIKKYRKYIIRVPYFPEESLIHFNGCNAFVDHHINTIHFCHSAWLHFLPDIREPILKKLYHIVYSYLNAKLEGFIMKRLAKTVVAVSEKVKRELIEDVGIPEGNIKVIYNGVDIKIFHPLRGNKKEEDYLKTLFPYKKGDFILLFAGDMRRAVKGVDTILKMAEILDNPNIVIENTDPYELVEIIINLYKNPSLKKRIGENARKTAMKYTWKEMAKRYEKLYMEILG